jgi:uridine kinase
MQGSADGLDGYDIVASASIVGKDLCLSNYDIPDALDTELLLEHLHLFKSGKVVGLPIYERINNQRTSALAWALLPWI